MESNFRTWKRVGGVCHSLACVRADCEGVTASAVDGLSVVGARRLSAACETLAERLREARRVSG